MRTSLPTNFPAPGKEQQGFLHPTFLFILYAIPRGNKLPDTSNINYDARITFTPIKIYERGVLEIFYCQATGTLLETHDERWPAGFT